MYLDVGLFVCERTRVIPSRNLRPKNLIITHLASVVALISSVVLVRSGHIYCFACFYQSMQETIWKISIYVPVPVLRNGWLSCVCFVLVICFNVRTRRFPVGCNSCFTPRNSKTGYCCSQHVIQPCHYIHMARDSLLITYWPKPTKHNPQSQPWQPSQTPFPQTLPHQQS
jgi:hypothetical protein